MVAMHGEVVVMFVVVVMAVVVEIVVLHYYHANENMPVQTSTNSKNVSFAPTSDGLFKLLVALLKARALYTFHHLKTK